jgi:hypothetical protein
MTTISAVLMMTRTKSPKRPDLSPRLAQGPRPLKCDSLATPA